jgi:predicted nucleic acid-binding protein
MAEPLCLVDSNILLRSVTPTHTDYAVIAAGMDSLVRDGYNLSQNLGEFWNACTRPAERNGYGLSPAQTDQRAKLFEANLHAGLQDEDVKSLQPGLISLFAAVGLLPDTLAVHEEWRKILVAHSVSGTQVHDARLVAAMRVHGAKHILTFNQRDFARYGDIVTLHPKTISRP